ncbi:GNAT family N-acetyltransferase [Sinimarinibacterium sp. CAU 1509]|uniref:GNAT family N-acetyltransferase n=1 Tax=Sinimarinibacterium sp. CAU 1509 TaxID=2562283 RepID=UPI0010ACD08A|nr:GNAT family protein [Sinimarinibacterium sp. CAU 1509]TJY55181.1 GNAT family N-acetyltransferase [Sinimarinibacterium sp. CAU 1509]
MKIENTVLRGTSVRLEPLTEDHLPGLARAIADGDLWALPVTLVPRPEELDTFLSSAEVQFAGGKELAFATVDQASGQVVGSTRFRCIEAAHRRVEIGFTFIAQSFQRTHVNTEAKLLMLRHAFEVWGVHRVELLTDVLNHRSRAAIARLGAREEGVLRHHMIMRDGRIRDSVVFSIIAPEWPAVEAALRNKLAAPRDAH